jgi:hypothetical protein
MSLAITGASFRHYQAMERTWLLMAIISIALSEHPTIRADRINRHLADRARKALFDLHARLEAL